MADVIFCSIGYHAQRLSDSASAAYWDGQREDFHRGHVEERFLEIADLLGFDVTKRQPAIAAE
ncbi:hypothetical protein CDV50_10400 [Haematobacter massiliensis]|uniref:hypothetical protein n=1 Tax=Haematobacter massiliensis TaxID=195105 RepID=UPI000B4979F6|nr:hypothetical protein [Haematobacter massiliensis]OWJ71406.1 hypothetical protein CDV50_10400 [Haematobacter massiliensis]